MTTTTELPTNPEVAGYLEEVAAHLAALPWLADVDRADLLDDLAQHLHEVAAEDGPPLAERLGPPAAYAEEVLAAAGLEPPPEQAAPTAGGIDLRAVLAAWWERAERILTSTGDLRPAWWVLRGYLAASLLATLTNGGDGAGFPVPAVGGTALLGIPATVVAVKYSIRWGKEGRPVKRWLRRLATAVLAVYGLTLLLNLDDGGADVQWVETASPIGNPQCLVNGAGRVIENLYPYDADGRLLDPVLLYDQTGRPLDNLCPQDYDERGRPVRTEYGRDVNGAPVINAFPRRQTVTEEPWTEGDPAVPTTTAPGGRPGAVAPPAVVVPQLATTTTTPTTVVTTTTTAGPAASATTPTTGGVPASPAASVPTTPPASTG